MSSPWLERQVLHPKTSHIFCHFAVASYNFRSDIRENVVIVKHCTTVIKVLTSSFLNISTWASSVGAIAWLTMPCFVTGFLASKRVRTGPTHYIYVSQFLTPLYFCRDYFASLVSGGTNVLIHRISRQGPRQ